MGAAEPDVVVARVLLVALAPVVLAAPPRWAVLAWLVMTNLDATGSGQPTNLEVGWLNAFKGLVLPAWLVWRLRQAGGDVHASIGGRCWAALALYAGLAATWSVFPLAGAKLALAMGGILLAAMALERAARAGLLDSRTILSFMLATLVLGVLQTALLGGGSFGYAGRGMPERFTSFVAAQQYAALLTALLAWVLWVPHMSPVRLNASVLALLAALAVNGSRTWSAGALLVLAVRALLHRHRTDLLRIAAAIAILASVPAVRRGLQAPSPAEPANRLTATASALIRGEDRPDGMGLGTARFRLRIYQGVWRAVQEGGVRPLVFGHGSASGGKLALELFPWAFRTETLDAARAIHNEWLRVLYEWGLVGLALWLAVLVSLAALAWKARRNEAGAALLSYLPALGLGLGTENILDGAGNAVTAGLLVLLALVLARYKEAEA